MKFKNILLFNKKSIVKQIKKQGFIPIYNFIEENKDSLYKIAWSYLKNHDDIEDIFQTTIIIVYKHINDLKNESYFKSWFTCILINECKKVLRKNKKTCNESYKLIDNVIIPSIDITIDIQRCLNKLPNIYKEPVILKYYGEFTQEEIANTLNIPIGTVKSRIYRGLKLLEKYMEDKEE